MVLATVVIHQRCPGHLRQHDHEGVIPDPVRLQLGDQRDEPLEEVLVQPVLLAEVVVGVPSPAGVDGGGVAEVHRHERRGELGLLGDATGGAEVEAVGEDGALLQGLAALRGGRQVAEALQAGPSPHPLGEAGALLVEEGVDGGGLAARWGVPGEGRSVGRGDGQLAVQEGEDLVVATQRAAEAA